MANLTKDEVKKIANLARISLTDEELDKYSKELTSILEYVHKVNEVDVSDIDFASNINDYVGDRMREDKVKEGMDVDDVLKNAGDRKKGNYITTSKIL